MNCSFTEKISSLIDGELSTAEAREVERHLLGCSECQQVRADFLNLRSQIAGFETSLAPAVQNRALKKILVERATRAGSRTRWSFGASSRRLRNARDRRLRSSACCSIRAPTRAWNAEQLAEQQEPTPVPAPSAQPKKQPEPEASPEPAREHNQHRTKATKKRRHRQAPAKKPLVREPKPGEQFAAIPSAPIRASADAQTLTAIHFEKSETLLVAFRNVRLNEPGTANEVAYERKRAQQLVLQNMMLRREADASGDVQISSLLESLEPILIDISNLPDKPDTTRSA